MVGAGELPLGKESFDMIPSMLGRADPPSVCLLLLTPKAVQEIGKVHLAKLKGKGGNSPRIVDKMPDNYIWLGFLTTLFPKGRFIYSRRDPRDIAVSCWITNFKHIRWACDMDDIAARIKSHLRIMDHWRKVLPMNMLEVDYQDTVADIEATAHKLIAHCGLEWDPACIRFYESSRPVRTASLSQVRKPVYRGSLERWRSYEKSMGKMFQLLESSREDRQSTSALH